MTTIASSIGNSLNSHTLRDSTNANRMIRKIVALETYQLLAATGAPARTRAGIDFYAASPGNIKYPLVHLDQLEEADDQGDDFEAFVGRQDELAELGITKIGEKKHVMKHVRTLQLMQERWFS